MDARRLLRPPGAAREPGTQSTFSHRQPVQFRIVERLDQQRRTGMLLVKPHPLLEIERPPPGRIIWLRSGAHNSVLPTYANLQSGFAPSLKPGSPASMNEGPLHSAPAEYEGAVCHPVHRRCRHDRNRGQHRLRRPSNPQHPPWSDP